MCFYRYTVANDQFKFKEYNADTNKCRKVTYCPTTGGHLTRLLSLPSPKAFNSRMESVSSQGLGSVDESSRGQESVESIADASQPPPQLQQSQDSSVPGKIQRFYIYAADEYVIGLGCLPFTGNPDLVRMKRCFFLLKHLFDDIFFLVDDGYCCPSWKDFQRSCFIRWTLHLYMWRLRPLGQHVDCEHGCI